MKKVALAVLFMTLSNFAWTQDKDEERVMKKLEKIIQLQKEAADELAKLSDELDGLKERLDKIEKQLKQQPRFGVMPMPPVERKERKSEAEDKKDEEQIKEELETQKRFNEAFKLHEEKKYEDAIKIFKEIYEKRPKDHWGATSAYNIACGYSLLSKKDEALDWLEKSIEAGFKDFDHMEKDTDLDNIRDDKRYKNLLEKAAEKAEKDEEEREEAY